MENQETLRSQPQGQGDSPWTVHADVEGNEFCELSARTL